MESLKLYEKYANKRHWEKHPTTYAEAFSEFLKKKRFKGKIVDVGCGNGRDVNIFKKQGFNCLGVDYSEQEINLAKQQFPELAFEVQNVEKLRFEDNSIDAFFIINVIHYVDMKKAISELYRTKNKNGYVFIHFNISITDKDGHQDYTHSEQDILNIVSKFKIVKKNIFERIDLEPIKHTHKIMELILEKV